jgi:hypothetical protein
MAEGQARTVDVRAVARFLVRGTRRAAVTIVGFTLVAVGLAGLLLPILPGWGLIIGGLLVLSREYSWAYNALAFSRRNAARGGASLRSLADRARHRRMVVVVLPSDDVVIDLTSTVNATAEVEAADEADEGVSATG